MILKNYYNMLTAFITGGETKIWELRDDGSTGKFPYYGKKQYASGVDYNSLYTSMDKITTAFKTAGICFGDGTAQPDINDITLSGNIILTLTGTATVTQNTDDNGTSVTSTIVLKNTGSKAVTLSEVGLIIRAYRSSGAAYNVWLLVDRTLLETPVTIPSNETRTINYTISIARPLGMEV